MNVEMSKLSSASAEQYFSPASSENLSRASTATGEFCSVELPSPRSPMAPEPMTSPLAQIRGPLIDISRSVVMTPPSRLSQVPITLLKSSLGWSCGLTLSPLHNALMTLLHEWLGHHGANKLLSSTSIFPHTSIGGKDSGKDIEIYRARGIASAGLARYSDNFDTPFAQVLGTGKSKAFRSLMGGGVVTYTNSATAYAAGRLLNSWPATSLLLFMMPILSVTNNISYGASGLTPLSEAEKQGNISHDYKNLSLNLSQQYEIDRLPLLRLIIAVQSLMPVASFCLGFIHSKQEMSSAQLKYQLPKLLVRLMRDDHELLKPLEKALNRWTGTKDLLNIAAYLNGRSGLEPQNSKVKIASKLMLLEKLHRFVDVMEFSAEGRALIDQLKRHLAQEAQPKSCLSKATAWRGITTATGIIAVASPLIRIIALNTSNSQAETAARAALFLLPAVKSVQSLGSVVTTAENIRSSSYSATEKCYSVLSSISTAAAAGVYAYSTIDWTSQDFGVRDFDDIVGGWELPTAIGLSALSTTFNWLQHSAATARTLAHNSEPVSPDVSG